MPVQKQINSTMNSLKSADLIRELKAETEKLVETNSMVVRPDTDLHGIVNLDEDYNFDAKLNNLPSLRRNVIPYPDHNYGQQPPLTPPEQASPDPNEQTDTGNEDEDEEGVTRCICGFAHDDGYMICCDRCGSWQHIDCMGIKSDSVPETYHCDRCEPRRLDVERARAIQQRKKDTLTDDDGDADTDTEEESAQTYRAISNTPTRITLTATSVIKKRGKNRLKSTNSEGKTKQRKRVNRKRQRTSTGQINETNLQIDSNSLESHSGFESFQEISENVYDPAIKSLGLGDTEDIVDKESSDLRKLFTVADVLENRKGLVAVEAINAGQIITEYKGKVLLKATYEDLNPFFKRSCPFLLHYNKIEEFELVIDSRTVGNEARYLRRSCLPNADVSHVVKGGDLHILVQCKQPILMGTEITIPFDYPLETYTGYIDCACKEPLCPVSKHNQRFVPQSGRKRSRFTVTDVNSSTRNSASENQGETDSDENELDVGRPMSRRKKLSREERKLQAYLKQIEKMEKKEKRVKDPKAPHRPGLVQDPGQPQGSVITKPMQSYEGSASPNHAVALPRRIAAFTPNSAGKKRININNKKRPRISSCSSDPLSPELITCSLIPTATTPVQEQSIQPQTVDQNGHIKQKAKKDRIQDGLPLSVNVDRALPSFRDVARKSRRDYLETVAGSPTPPSTPGQLSPAASNQQNNLSVESSGGLVSPTGPYLSVHEKRNVLNGLLQIADQNDDQSTCSGSPQPSVITSNGMVTSEEVMGEMMLRDSAPHTPASKVPQRRLSNDCRYFGSLKKRWLIQYDRHTPFDIQPRNGLSSCLMANYLNETSIQKRAEQIASYVFKTPKSVTLSKKHRLKETVIYASEYLKEVAQENNHKNSIHQTEKTDQLLTNNLSPSQEGTTLNHANVESLSTVTNHVTSVPTYDPRKSLAAAFIKKGTINANIDTDNSETEKTDIKTNMDMTGSFHKLLPNDADFSNNVICTSAGVILTPNKKHKPTLHELGDGNQLSNILQSADTKDSTVTNLLKEETTKDALNSTDIGGPSLKSDHDNDLAYTTPNLQTLEHDSHISVNKTLSNSHTGDDDRERTSITVTNIVVNDSSTKYLVKPVPTTDEGVPKGETDVTDLPINTGDVRALSILRDPRLSSSSSRSSRDSIDGHVLVRSDSVSSLEDGSIQRANLDKRSFGDKSEGNRHTKKKMSLREYRNRKKTKPAANLMQRNSTNSDGSGVKSLSQPILFTDTDSLLTPRTLSLSTGFTPLSGKEVTLTTSSSGAVSMTTLISPHTSVQMTSNGPLFEPVSPSEDYSSEAIIEVKPDSSSSYGNYASLVHDIPPQESMEIDGEVPLVTCQSDANLIPQKDPSQQRYNSLQQATGLPYQPHESSSSSQRNKNICSSSPIYRQTQVYHQHFHG